MHNITPRMKAEVPSEVKSLMIPKKTLPPSSSNIHMTSPPPPSFLSTTHHFPGSHHYLAFSLLDLILSTGSWAHPASYPMGTGSSLPGVNRL
jgi:hypothetical protein